MTSQLDAVKPVCRGNAPTEQSQSRRRKRTWMASAALILGTLTVQCNIGFDDSGTDSTGEESKEAGKVKRYYLSDLKPVSASNGWGDIELDKSNGEKKDGDGHTLSVGGHSYQRGLGAHAPSKIVYNLNGNCAVFLAIVGVDDETKNRGSVVFKLFADDESQTPIYQSKTLMGGGDTDSLKIDVTGIQKLQMVVEDSGDDNKYDHASWADAYLKCSDDPRHKGRNSTPKPKDSGTPSTDASVVDSSTDSSPAGI